MGYALFSSGPNFAAFWSVVILNQFGECLLTLPRVCESSVEARNYAEAYLRFFS